MIYSQIH
jgi:hypothetical protein